MPTHNTDQPSYIDQVIAGLSEEDQQTLQDQYGYVPPEEPTGPTALDAFIASGGGPLGGSDDQVQVNINQGYVDPVTLEATDKLKDLQNPSEGPTPEEQLKEATGNIREQEQALADFQYNVAIRNQIRQANMARAQASLAISAGENVQVQRGMTGSAAARLQQADSFAQGSITSQLGQNLDAFSTSRELGRNVIEAQQGLEDLQFDLAAEARQRGEFLQMQQIRQANEAQQFQSTLSLIGTGASIGFYAGGPAGALAGAAIGGVASLFDF